MPAVWSADMDTLRVTRHEGIVTVTLSRPDKKNAANATMWDELLDVFRSIGDNDDDRVVVITGDGGDASDDATVTVDRLLPQNKLELFTQGLKGLAAVRAAPGADPTAFASSLPRSAQEIPEMRGYGFAVVYGLARFRRSPVGTVLEAIRENEQRARFLGYPTNRYKLVAFTVSATVTGLAGVLSVFTHRFASAEPLGSAFSGELLAMVVIGGMRSLAGPAIGALFFILFREMLSIWTANWLFWFGLLFVGFILFSPDGLVGIGRRLYRMVRPPATEERIMDTASEPFVLFTQPG